VLDAYVIGLWLKTLASESDLAAFMSGARQPPKFGSIAQRLRKTHPLGELFEKQRHHFKTLSDYTHGFAGRTR